MSTQLINNPYNKTFNQTGSCFGLFDTKLTDHILEGQDAVGWALQGSLITTTYPDAVAKVKELYENGAETEYRGITCRRSTDGRYVADVAQKDAIDTLFTESGVADFYILDVDNNQFYLPRSIWFNQMTIDTSLVNNFNEAGLPNIEGQVSTETALTSKGCFYNIYAGDGGYVGTGASPTNFGLDASRSNPLYGNSDTVQPPSSNKLLYYKVGNTVVNESQIDVGNVLSDLQLKADTDLANTTPSQMFKDMSMDWGIPDYSKAIDIRSLSSYTCPCNGYLVLGCYSGALGYNTSRASSAGIAYQVSSNQGYSQISFYPVVKNEVLTRSLNNGSITICCFVPMKGAETNA